MLSRNRGMTYLGGTLVKRGGEMGAYGKVRRALMALSNRFILPSWLGRATIYSWTRLSASSLPTSASCFIRTRLRNPTTGATRPVGRDS